MTLPRTTTTFLASAVCLAALAGAADAQVDLAWSTVYPDDAEPFTGRSLAVAGDGSSFVIADIGTTRDRRIAVAAFEPSGDFRWRRDIDISDQEIAVEIVLATDESAVYAVGRTSIDRGSNYLVVKYDAATGSELWSRSWAGPMGGINDPRDAAPTPDGGVVITGGVFMGDQQRDYGTIKYSADGDVAWSATFGDNGRFLFRNDVAEHVAVDINGDVVITGDTSPGSGGSDVVTIRYDGTTGAEQWLARYSTSANEVARDIAIAPDGDAIVFGTDPFGIDRQWLTIRYDATDGTELWATREDVGFDELPRAVAVDADRVYVTGATDPDRDDDNDNEQLITIAYDAATGAREWIDIFGGLGINEFDIGGDVVVTGRGTIIVVGSTATETVTGDSINTDAYLRVHDAATGTVLDTDSIDTDTGDPFAIDDFFAQAGQDGAGSLVVRGSISGDVFRPNNLLLARYAPTSAPCPADLDGDGELTIFDFLVFQNLFDLMDPSADFDGDGEFTFSTSWPSRTPSTWVASSRPQ